MNEMFIFVGERFHAVSRNTELRKDYFKKDQKHPGID
jgi:hypothetical protein